MGTDFKCGCRSSGWSWYLCKEHEAELLMKLEGDGLDKDKGDKGKEAKNES